MNNPYAALCTAKKRPLFIPFTVLGDPDKETSLGVIKTLIENGADALELGLPFSDPTADGPTIQAADVRALKAGITIDDCFWILHEIRKTSQIPIGLLVYYNLVMQRGIRTFYEDCRKAGVSSVLIADLPPEHAGDVSEFALVAGIAQVFIVSELTTDVRLAQIVKVASGYLYLVGYLGVTGRKEGVKGEGVSDLIKRVRRVSDLPLFVGFGVSTAEQVRLLVKAGADGVIVGSRIVADVPDLDRIAATCKELHSTLPRVQ